VTAAPRGSVLIIDDEQDIRDVLALELGREGFEATTAEGGHAALAAARRRRFDLAITDLKMPGMDGIATLEGLKAIDPAIQVLIATGYASEQTRAACMERGACGYLQKPFDLDEIVAAVRRVLVRMPGG
jgi:DNA-binding NtrC family response regulator